MLVWMVIARTFSATNGARLGLGLLHAKSVRSAVIRSYGDCALYVRVRLVIHQLKVLEVVAVDALRFAQYPQVRKAEWSTSNLRFHLLEMIGVDVDIAAGPYEVADIQVALMREKHLKEGVARDIEGYA